MNHSLLLGGDQEDFSSDWCLFAGETNKSHNSEKNDWIDIIVGYKRGAKLKTQAAQWFLKVLAWFVILCRYNQPIPTPLIEEEAK